MPKNSKITPTAIDFYSGIGGWSLGFKLAGINILSSYEWWDQANETHNKNLGANVHQTDIRKLDISEIATGVDFVIGSPPCTQFSFSNRGGSGDIKDGLEDIKQFLRIVKKVKPKCWAMENVPRVANVLKAELSKGGCLEEFLPIVDESMIHVIDFSEFGLPQKRKRCIAGNFDYGLLQSYRKFCKKKVLGDVIAALRNTTINDPNFGFGLGNNAVTELETEEALSWEELRYNREAKTHHTVYNNMAFPDPFDKPVRTITATCTRISRESVVIADGEEFRRLSVRERGTLQGFPIDFQFLGKSYASKLKMIGNAVPPVFTYYLANAMLNTSVDALVPLEEARYQPRIEGIKTTKTDLDSSGKSYPKSRSFRFAIPNLRFKSGTRFELSNSKDSSDWQVKFFFGDSKRIQTLKLNRELVRRALKMICSNDTSMSLNISAVIASPFFKIDGDSLQARWTGNSTGTHPFDVLDELGKAALLILKILEPIDQSIFEEIVISEAKEQSPKSKTLVGEKKLRAYAREITCGIIVGSAFNLNGEM